MNNKELGRIGEDMAVRMLMAKGYRILDRNYRCQTGEIDIIAARDRKISFIEVKTRSGYLYGRPCEAVDQKKQKNIRRTAVSYLRETKAGGYVYSNIGFDVVEIVIEHIESAF